MSPFPDVFRSNLRTPAFAVLTYISVSATAIGISHDFSYYFISFINASSLLGRLAGGSISDRIGESFFFFNCLLKIIIGSISHR